MRTRRARAGVALAVLCAAALALAACSAPDPLDELDGLGGPGLHTRCQDGLPELDGAFLEGCTGGELQGQFVASFDAGPVDLLVLCDDAEKVSIVTDASGPIPTMVRVDCPEGADAVRTRVADLDAPTDTIVKIAQQGAGESAWFLVPGTVPAEH